MDIWGRSTFSNSRTVCMPHGAGLVGCCYGCTVRTCIIRENSGFRRGLKKRVKGHTFSVVLFFLHFCHWLWFSNLRNETNCMPECRRHTKSPRTVGSSTRTRPPVNFAPRRMNRGSRIRPPFTFRSLIPDKNCFAFQSCPLIPTPCAKPPRGLTVSIIFSPHTESFWVFVFFSPDSCAGLRCIYMTNDIYTICTHAGLTGCHLCVCLFVFL